MINRIGAAAAITNLQGAQVINRALLLLSLLLASSFTLASPTRGEFAPYAGQHDLLPLYPARPAFGSGTVFRIKQSVDGSRYTRVICRSLFAGITPQRKPYAVNSALYSDPERFAEAVGILYGLLTSARQTEENLHAQRASHLKLSYQGAMLEELPASIRLSESGAAYRLDPVCLAALAKLKDEGVQDTLYVVDRALVVDRFRIEIERPPGGSTQDAIDVLDVNTDYVKHSKGKEAVEIEAPYYIGMNALSIVDIAPATPGADPDVRVVKAVSAKLPDRYRSWE
ncbi:MAG TPA: hypothetical protein VK491_03015 [Gemmatimonadaceae bacterium]|nr:hypothetical protein [Gemmatimonadaceae bacterium]